jgi:hypothetical protein
VGQPQPGQKVVWDHDDRTFTSSKLLAQAGAHPRSHALYPLHPVS